MRRAIKKTGNKVVAYQLGVDDREINELIKEGKIKKLSDTQYEIFSQEAINGIGEKANVGDYIKIDSTHHPYPNDKEFFIKNHRHITANEYEQISKPVWVWQADEPMCQEVQFLLDNKGLHIAANEEKKYFTAPLWGTTLSAAQNAYIVFYDIQKNSEGKIIDIDFNFVENKEFELTYEILSK